jgi:hypothetical protein
MLTVYGDNFNQASVVFHASGNNMILMMLQRSIVPHILGGVCDSMVEEVSKIATTEGEGGYKLTKICLMSFMNVPQ